MSGKWKKIIWALLMVQMCFFHVFFLGKIRYTADYLWYRVCGKFGLPYFLYEKGFALVVLGMTLVSLLMVLVYFVNYRNFRVRCINGIVPVEDEVVRRKLEKAWVQAGIRQADRSIVYKNIGIAEPFVLGFYHPVILLPDWACSLAAEGAVGDLAGQAMEKSEMLDVLLLHECVHIRHKDTWYKLFLFLCNALCWYNPLAYLFRSISGRDIEIDCDETVVSGCGKEERAAYGQFLIDSLEKMRTRGYVHSVFFSAGEGMMKARIAAIMEEKKPYNVIAGFAVALLVLQTVFLAGTFGKRMMIQVKEQQASENINIYEGFEKPECFTREVLERMLPLAPAKEDSYYQELMSLPYSEVESYEELPYAAEGPWQVRLKRPEHYGDCIDKFMYRYLNYDRDQTAAGRVSLEEPGAYTGVEAVYWRMLAGDQKEFVFAAVIREFLADESALDKVPFYGQVQMVDGYYYTYYPVAVHVKMVKDYVFELQGITQMTETVVAFREAYPENDYSDIPVFTGKPEEERDDVYETRTSGGVLEIRKKGQEKWETAPVTLEELFTRGDGMDGTLTRLQEGSYQCDEIKQIFAYGGSPVLPLSVVFYDETAGAYRSSVVTNTRNFGSVRRIFVSFPENAEKGFLVITTDRTMWQEYTTCFVTEDGGKNWRECLVVEGAELMSHSLTTDMRFITNEVGFITIRDSETPFVIRTGDGGETWSEVKFNEIKEYYSMAYAPFWEKGKWTMDVCMEEQSVDGGVKARYVTDDLGETWKFQGFVLRQ
jgi:beta-lactamase regulating signal transducer with metallopeptidase domain